jgi:hypothetical protein
VFRLASILLSALWFSGCFIADEIRKGDSLIEQHSVGWREKKKGIQKVDEEAAKAEAADKTDQARNAGPGVKDKLSDWWHETVDEEPVITNSDDKIVSCRIGGKVQFLRESDCQLRRGRTTKLKTGTKSTGAAGSKPKPGA